MQNTEIKSIKGWQKFADEHPGENTDWGTYCKVGDLVDDEAVEYFMNILPPRALREGYMQVGEAHGMALNRETGKYQSTFATFEKAEGTILYRYCGVCFAGGTEDMEHYKKYDSVNHYLKATRRVAYGCQIPRPRILCKDGFEFSVQAGKQFYSSPRSDEADTIYQACEVGMPNAKEDLLMPYIESARDEPTKAIYPYTPVDVIEQVIAKHGGYYVAGIPMVRM